MVRYGRLKEALWVFHLSVARWNASWRPRWCARHRAEQARPTPPWRAAARLLGGLRFCGPARILGGLRLCGAARVVGSLRFCGSARVVFCHAARVLGGLQSGSAANESGNDPEPVGDNEIEHDTLPFS